MGFTKGPEEALEELERFDALSTSQPVPGDGRKRSGWGIAIRVFIPIWWRARRLRRRKKKTTATRKETASKAPITPPAMAPVLLDEPWSGWALPFLPDPEVGVTILLVVTVWNPVEVKPADMVVKGMTVGKISVVRTALVLEADGRGRVLAATWTAGLSSTLIASAFGNATLINLTHALLALPGDLGPDVLRGSADDRELVGESGGAIFPSFGRVSLGGVFWGLGFATMCLDWPKK
jgi:hypothetical protein